MLARNGVQRIRLVDFDQVTLSSLNRHAAASYADVGLPKAVVLQRYIKQVAPFVEVDARVTLFDKKRADDLLGGAQQGTPSMRAMVAAAGSRGRTIAGGCTGWMQATRTTCSTASTTSTPRWTCCTPASSASCA